jgi:hypothetical protein
MKKQLKLTAILLSLIMVLTACQKTPESSIVQEKNLENLIVKAIGDDEPATSANTEFDYANTVDLAALLDVPQKYISDRDFPVDWLTLTADAEFDLPNYAMPLLRVEAMDFEQEFADRIYELLIGDKPMFYSGYENGTMTKEEIDSNIKDFKESIADLENMIQTGQTVDRRGFEYFDPEESIEYIKKMIAEFEAIYDSAPATRDDIVKVPGTNEIKKRDTLGWTGKVNGFYNGFMVSCKDELHGFSVANNGGKFFDDEAGLDSASVGAGLSYHNAGLTDYNLIMGSHITGTMHFGSSLKRGEWSNPEWYIMEIENVSVDEFSEITATSDIFGYGDAVKAAEKFLKDAGINDMKVSSMKLGYVIPYDLYSGIAFQTARNGGKEDTTDALEQFVADLTAGKYNEQIKDVQIVVNFSRYFNGIPVSSGPETMKWVSIGDINPEDENDSRSFSHLNKNWEYESFSMTLSDKGILVINWNSPLKVTQVITDDANLISFDDAKSIFENMFRIKYSGYMAWRIERAKSYGTVVTLKHEGEVYKVVLSLRRIVEQNSLNKGLLVPVWDFYGAVITHYKAEGGTLYSGGIMCGTPYSGVTEYSFVTPWTGMMAWGSKDLTERELPTSLLEPLMSINAIDGTLIDLRKGY